MKLSPHLNSFPDEALICTSFPPDAAALLAGNICILRQEKVIIKVLRDKLESFSHFKILSWHTKLIKKILFEKASLLNRESPI